MERLRRENRELKQADEILEPASAISRGIRTAAPIIVGFIDEYRGVYDVESIYRALSAPGVRHAARAAARCRPTVLDEIQSMR